MSRKKATCWQQICGSILSEGKKTFWIKIVIVVDASQCVYPLLQIVWTFRWIQTGDFEPALLHSCVLLVKGSTSMGFSQSGIHAKHGIAFSSGYHCDLSFLNWLWYGPICIEMLANCLKAKLVIQNTIQQHHAHFSWEFVVAAFLLQNSNGTRHKLCFLLELTLECKKAQIEHICHEWTCVKRKVCGNYEITEIHRNWSSLHEKRFKALTSHCDRRIHYGIRACSLFKLYMFVNCVHNFLRKRFCIEAGKSALV